MELVAHRVNDIGRLEGLPPELGAEIDLRTVGGRIVLHHEVYEKGPAFEDFVEVYARTRRDRLLILNPKEDGLDAEVLAVLKKAGVGNFFFLDLSFPSIVRMCVRGGEKRAALRVSEYEPAEAAMSLAGRAAWVWQDCFDGKPADAGQVRRLREAFKVCLVSPELEGYPKERIADFRHLAEDADAVCTKHPDLWR